MELWFSEYHTPDVKYSIRVNRHLYSHQSEYQQIDIYDTPEFGRALVLDGNVMLTERDEFIYDEMITHVPMAAHPGIGMCLSSARETAAWSKSLPAIHRFSGSIWWKWIIRLLRPAVYTFRKMPANWTMSGYISILIMLCALFGGAKMPTI